jgi:hypothetical protein
MEVMGQSLPPVVEKLAYKSIVNYPSSTLLLSIISFPIGIEIISYPQTKI